MNILIIEDEEPAALRLKKILNELEPDAQVLDIIVSVKSAVEWLNKNATPDLILLDIHLADGSSFEIFKLTEVKTPVIFITAYDEYAVQAFKVTSVDYLLKPIKKEDLAAAIKKYKSIYIKTPNPPMPDFGLLLETLRKPQPEFKKRFLIRFGEHIKAIDAENIAYFYTEEKINFLRTTDNHTYHVDYNLDKLEEMLDPERFFRINRQFIISINSIDQMFSFSKSRVKINLKPPINLDTIVSTERSPLFKEWLAGKE
ncbi:MAG: response regulator transcription factor [Bacteroidetes bacterium]|nr:response regulator transcription factor [Bacteroidota bacterium]MBL0138991.1 response regulator transcription factor [Bacteroidota bacterium]